MAADLAAADGFATEGRPQVQLCGDAHLANFGCYASPEGTPIFDVNDFDETAPGPFDWDIKRLAASLVLSGREQGLPDKRCRALAARSARHYRRHMGRLARLTPLEAWHSTIDMEKAIDGVGDHALRRHLRRRLRHAAAASRDHYGLAGGPDGTMAIREDAAGRTRHLPAYRPTIEAAFAAYLDSLPPPFRELAARYRLIDSAFKVVGIGSVGTFCAIGLFVSSAGATLMLQLKEAQRSVLAWPSAATDGPEGERVVIGQRRLQAQSDVFLGWIPAPVDGRQFYVRKLKDSRLAEVASVIEADALPFSAALCGRTLARAHGRTGERAPAGRCDRRRGLRRGGRRFRPRLCRPDRGGSRGVLPRAGCRCAGRDRGGALMLPEATLAAAAAMLQTLRQRGSMLATAESCTGGLIAAALTHVAGSSDVVRPRLRHLFERGEDDAAGRAGIPDR